MWCPERTLRRVRAFPTQRGPRALWVWPDQIAIPMDVSFGPALPLPIPDSGTSDRQEWENKLRAYWCACGVVVIVTDGSLKRKLAPDRLLQVKHWMGVGWALGLATASSETRMSGDDPGPVDWILQEGKALIEDRLATASSFFSESAALAMALRRLTAAMAGAETGWGPLVHLTDNEGRRLQLYRTNETVPQDRSGASRLFFFFFFFFFFF